MGDALYISTFGSLPFSFSYHPLFIKQLNTRKFPVVFCRHYRNLRFVGVTAKVDVIPVTHRAVDVPIGNDSDCAVFQAFHRFDGFDIQTINDAQGPLGCIHPQSLSVLKVHLAQELAFNTPGKHIVDVLIFVQNKGPVGV